MASSPKPDLTVGRSFAIKAWQVLARTTVAVPDGFMVELAQAVSTVCKESRDLGVELPCEPRAAPAGKWLVSSQGVQAVVPGGWPPPGSPADLMGGAQ